MVVSCKKKLATDASQSSAGNPGDLIPEEEAKTGQAAVEAFVNQYAGVYYSEGTYGHWEWGIGYTNTGLKVDYKFKNGKVYSVNAHNQTIELFVEPVEAVSPTSKKLQLRHKDKGEVLVLNMTEEGLESYVSYILEKVSEDVLIENAGTGANVPELAAYKGTYNSLAQDNKIENYIAIDGEGNVFFYDANVTLDGGRASVTEEGELTILESHANGMRKIIFKFDQGVYRRFAIDGARENIDETYIGICQVSTDFIEDRFADALYQTEDAKTVKGHDTQWGYYPDELTGISIKLNEKNDDFGHDVSEGAVAISGNDIGDAKGHTARGAMVGHVSVLKGNTLHIMGRYNAEFVFSDDWKTATYNGQTLHLISGEVKAPATVRKTTSTGKYGLTPLKKR